MSIRLLLSLLLFSLVLLPATAGGQSPYYFRHYEVEHGLSNNTVLCSVMDKKGFMWFGTIDGLNRFDGYTFKVFRNDPANPKSLGNNSVFSLLTTDDGKILAGTAKGLYYYDPVDQSFELIPFTSNKEVGDLCKDNSGNIWFTIDKTLNSYSEHSKTVRSYPPEVLATSICKDQDGNVWVGTANGFINKYDKATDRFTSYDLFSKSRATSGKYITKIFNTNKGSLLVGTLNQGIKLFDIKTKDYKDLLIYNHDKTEIFAKDFIQYSEDEYWVATEYGLFIYNINGGKFTTLRMQYNNSYSISDNAINTLYRDREGGIWAGTRFGGISYYPYPYTSFEKYFSQNGINSIKGNGVHEICPDGRGNLWIGTEDAGLNKLNVKTKVFEHFVPDGKKGSISYSNIHGLLIVDNELWIGTYQYGLDRMNLKTGKIIKHYTAGKNSFASNFIVHLYKTKSGNILVGTWEGLFQYNKLTDSFSPVAGFPFQTQSILEDENGLLWICTLGNGVFTLNQKTGLISNFRANFKSTDSLANNMVNGQFRDSRGNLWFATEGGLSKYDPRVRKFKTYSITNGLPSNFLFKILEDKKNNLWISSTKGLICFNPISESIKIYTVADGLLNDQFNWNSAYKDSTGRMYFGSVKGMISFVPEKFTINTITPPVYITGIQLYDKELVVNGKKSPLKKSITYTDQITLRHDQSTLSIDFAALSYTSPEMNEYAYKMEGLDADWTPLKTYRKAYFTELPPGVYTFKVKAANSSGIWNKEETSLRIEILPPFWKSKLAYLLYSVLAIAIVYVVFRIYHNRINEKHERKIELLAHENEKALYQNKIDFFTNIAHEIRTPLTLIQGPMENIMNHADKVPEIKNNLRIMERNTNRLLDISNQLLDFRKIEAKGFSLNFEKINIPELVEDMHASFQPLADHRYLSYSLQTPSNDFYAMVDNDSFQKILSNLYSNAIKYAENTVQVRLAWLEKENEFLIEFKNDGLLIPADSKEKIFEPFFRIKETNYQNGTGIGLAISRALTELHKGTLELKEPRDGFNIFVLTLPINTSNEPDYKIPILELNDENFN
ncbi:ligand-binding sensor domain-containing protein [Terrimonas alba]|uniref:ligand-binding sensor domain-containing protein n=1 Tax=Terrimonas alba TaxID=3349636 RepID=UPI0035F4FDDB